MSTEPKYGRMNNIYTQCSEVDDIVFAIRTVVGEINTVIPVKVVAVYGAGSGNPTGYVDVLPLVGYTDADGNLIDMTTLYHLPYFRYQGGVASVVIDPVKDDIGLAVFAQRDSTNVVVGTKETVRPASFRVFSISDGWYIGGFLNQKPKIFLELKQDETATLTAQKGITLNVKGGCTINAIDGGCTINGDTTINGNLVVTADHTSTMNGSVSVVNGDVTADGISLKNHVHGGVQTGSGRTGKPQ